MPEEETFAVFVKIMQDYRMREMFKPSMAELGLCMYQLEVLVQEHITDLYGHFQSQSIHTNLYASSWFLTLFTTSLPIQLSCRIMDCFLADGIEVIFRLALALLLIGKNELLIQDMEGVIRVKLRRNMTSEIVTIFSSPTVLPKRNASQVRGRSGRGDQPGIQHQDQPKENEETGERVHDNENQGERRRDRAPG